MKILVSTLCSALLMGATLTPPANPNGTRPTRLRNVSVTAVNSSQMRVQGHFETLSGQPIGGMQVTLWSVDASSFTNWSRVYTDNNGNFSVVTYKVPAGNQIQVEVEGNGAYSRPYPTYSRP